MSFLNFLIGFFAIASVVSVLGAIGFLARRWLEGKWVMDSDTFLAGIVITILTAVIYAASSGVGYVLVHRSWKNW